MKKILTVSLFAMMAVSAANADIASTKYVDDIAKTKQASLGFTPENVANKVTSVTSASTNTQYPSAQAVYQYVSGEMTSLSDKNDGLKTRVDTLESAVTAKGALQDVVGDAESGLVKDVADLETNKADKSYVDTELGKKQNNLSTTQMAAVNSGITTDKVTKYDGYDAKITAAKKAGDDAQATANSAVTVNTQQATAISGNTAAINTLKGDKTVTGSVAKSIDDAFTAANLSQYATTSTMNTELGKKQNKLSADQLSAVNSGITSDKVTKYDGYDTKITTAQTSANNAKTAADNAQKTADGAVTINSQQATAISGNTAAINTLKGDKTVTGSVDNKIYTTVGELEGNKTVVGMINDRQNKSTAMSLGTTDGAWIDLTNDATTGWVTSKCNQKNVTCSLVSKDGSIKWEKVTY